MEIYNIENDWEFGVLDIYDFRTNNGSLRFFFEFIKKYHDEIDGDIVEAGVFRGKSLLAIALMLKEIGSEKKIYGFDSFSGFPPIYHENDEFKKFKVLMNKNRISRSHYKDAVRSKEIREMILDDSANAESLSSSLDFSSTSKNIIENKLKYLGLDNVFLVDGEFSKTMNKSFLRDKKIMCALMDCDLYESYKTAFSFIWPKLSRNGIIYLDEYYSLKFPGARIATDEFCQDNKNAEMFQHPSLEKEFERWSLVKK